MSDELNPSDSYKEPEVCSTCRFSQKEARGVISCSRWQVTDHITKWKSNKKVHPQGRCDLWEEPWLRQN